MNNKNKSINLKIWRIITYFWGVFSAVLFILSFFQIINCNDSIKTITLIYISVLSIFISLKEIYRWKNKSFLSKYKGEIFVLLYTLMMICFIILNIFNSQKYIIPSEFTTTYLAILGIFALSTESKRRKGLR